MIKPLKETSVKSRCKFDETFKREALNNWPASGRPAEVIAQELGLNASRPYAWKQIFAAVRPPISKASWRRCGESWRACSGNRR